MKILRPLFLGCLLVTSYSFAETTNEADKKWLEVVGSKVAAGQTQVSTPSEARVTLLKEWAAKNGYSLEVTKSEAGYRIELSKSLAKK